MTIMRAMAMICGLLVAFVACQPSPKPQPSPAAAPPAATQPLRAHSGGGGTTVLVQNQTSSPATVYVAFGSDSVVLPAAWSSFCTLTDAGTPTCTFNLVATTGSQPLPLNGQYLNATMSFNATATCGSTKAELNFNNPNWYDITDVSLVDGFSNKIQITYVAPSSTVVSGPPVGATGNETVFGVFPYGCDICVARQSPPCGIPVGTSGCKAGTQYKPAVPCQYQGPLYGGGGAVTVALVQ